MEKTNKQIGFLLLGIKFYYRGILDIVRAVLLKALKFFNFHLKFWIVWFLFSMLILIGVYFLWEYVNSSTAAKDSSSYKVPSLSDSSSEQNQSVEEFAKFISDIGGQIIWWIISFVGLSIGLYLTLWGRIMHHRLHLNERYKDAAIMLGNEDMIMRIAGCRSLRSLGIDDKSMKERSVRLLFCFINDFYFKKEHQNKKLEKIFSKDDILKPDIQEAIRSFSFIYRHYRSSGIDNQLVDLSPGFWQSRKKGRISLIKANLMHEILQDAYLYEANLYGANLSDANLQGANLNRVDLTRARLYKTDFRNADITDAIMDNVENLTKEQILSAKWGLDKKGKGEPPLLKEELRDDSDIQKWLTSPHYNEKEKLKKHEKNI